MSGKLLLAGPVISAICGYSSTGSLREIRKNFSALQSNALSLLASCVGHRSGEAERYLASQKVASAISCIFQIFLFHRSIDLFSAPQVHPTRPPSATTSSRPIRDARIRHQDRRKYPPPQQSMTSPPGCTGNWQPPHSRSSRHARRRPPIQRHDGGVRQPESIRACPTAARSRHLIGNDPNRAVPVQLRESATTRRHHLTIRAYASDANRWCAQRPMSCKVPATNTKL